MKTIQSRINSLAITRARLGLTQQQMAVQLGISVSMIKQVETNRRFLTSDNLVKLAALEITMANIHKQVEEKLPVSMQEMDASADAGYQLEAIFQESRCRHLAKQLEKELKKMEVDYEQIKTTLYNLDAVATLTLKPNDPFLRTMMQVRPKLMRKLIKCSLQAQVNVKKKIALLHAEAALNKSIHPRYVHKNEKPILSPLKQSNMNYTVSLISSRPDCQAMIDMANDDVDALVYRKTGLVRQMQAATNTTVSVDADLVAVTAEIEALQTIITGLPDGSTKEDTRVKLTKAEYRKFTLELRKANFGSVALVEKEYSIACVEQSIAETHAFITALTTRMNELPAA